MNIMRHSKEYMEKCKNRGRLSQKIQENERLLNAIEYVANKERPDFEINTINHRTGQTHKIIIIHESGNGSGKNNVYLDGELWRNGWSRSRFARWLVGRIDYVFNGWQ